MAFPCFGTMVSSLGGESRSLDASPGKGIYENFTVDKSVPDVGDKLERGWPEGFECHPNGDSVKFQKIYGIPECDHLVRGTYRNIGWCDTMFKISQLGMLSEEPCAVSRRPAHAAAHTRTRAPTRAAAAVPVC